MGKYLLRRLFVFLPTLFAITLISFTITVNAPGDPVERLIGGGSELEIEKRFRDAEYLQKRSQLGLDLPVFYFSLASLADCDTLHRLPRPDEQSALAELTARYGNWDRISEYHQRLVELSDAAFGYAPLEGEEESLSLFRAELLTLRHTVAEPLRTELVVSLDTLVPHLNGANGVLQSGWNAVGQSWKRVEGEPTRWKTYVPSLHIHGFRNQYHRWLVNLLQLDLGVSFQDGKPVITRIGEALRWTFFISIFVVIITYIGSMWLGTYAAVRRNTRQERIISLILFVLYSLPSFWVATLLINFLASPDYLRIFPTSGVMSDGASSWPFLQRMGDYAWHLFLPTLCYLYASFTAMSRQMRSGMLEVLQADFIRTARAKGLPESKVVWRHALRNSLLPLITTFAGVFPALVGGSVIIESIFAIPGMGREIITAISQSDYPVVIGIFTLSACLTIFGILVSDVLYAVADPRISFSRR